MLDRPPWSHSSNNKKKRICGIFSDPQLLHTVILSDVPEHGSIIVEGQGNLPNSRLNLALQLSQ